MYEMTQEEWEDELTYMHIADWVVERAPEGLSPEELDDWAEKGIKDEVLLDSIFNEKYQDYLESL